MTGPEIINTGIQTHRPDVVLMGNQPPAMAITINNELVHVAEPATEPAPRVKRAYKRRQRPAGGTHPREES